MLARVPFAFAHLYQATVDTISLSVSATNAANVSKDIADSALAEVEENEYVSLNINDARLSALTAMVAACLASEAASKVASAAALVVIEAKKMKVLENREIEAQHMIDVAISSASSAEISAKSAQLFSEVAIEASKVALESENFSEVISQAYIAISAAENISKTVSSAATNAIYAAIAGNSIIYFAGADVVPFTFRGDRLFRTSRNIPEDVRKILTQCQLAFFPTIQKKEITDELYREIWTGAVFKWAVTPELKYTLSKVSMDWEISLGPIFP